MSGVLFVVLLLFTLKVAWNFMVPYILASRFMKAKGGQVSGISLMPFLEVILLLLACGLSFIDGSVWPYGAQRVFLLGGGVLLASYVHFFVGGMIAGWIVSRLSHQHDKVDP
jgi:hypothetical protein